MFYEFERPPIPEEVLNQCYTVVLYDSNVEKPHEIRAWARQNCQSFICAESTDISDFSLEHDYAVTFYFGKEADQLMFRLKYSS